MAETSYMHRSEARETVHWSSGINIIAGIWLIIAPFALSYSDIDQAVWNDVIIGIAVFILAIVRTGNPLKYEPVGWVNIVLGIWLIIAPFVLGYTAEAVTVGETNGMAALWNDIILGIIIVVLAAISVYATHKAPPPRPHDPQRRYE